MYKVLISTKVDNVIKKFIIAYREKYIEMYTDTGIFYENIIRDNYIHTSKKFKNEIYENINFYFSPETILGVKIWKENNKEYIFTVGNYRFFVEYIEEKDERIRFIKSLKIFRK